MIMRQIIITACLVAWGAGAARAADTPGAKPDDADALSLADQAKPAARSSRDWRVFGEGVIARAWQRGAPSPVEEARLSLDLRYDSTIAPGLRAVLSDRLDLTHRNAAPRETNLNTLREAYLSWHASPDQIADIGRVNLRYGAAMGYNPTDFFRAGALRSIVSPDPVSLRENRQGTFAIQGQQLWSHSSLSGVFSPRLGNTTSDSTFALDLGATNPRNRWLLAGSHKFAPEFNPQLLVFGGVATPTQVGLNLSALVNTATVAFGEFSTGKGRSLVAHALGSAETERMQRRAAVGVTYTTAFNLSLTAEVEHNSAAPDRQQWNAFSAGAPGNTLRLLDAAQALQELPVRQALFFYASWKDMLVRNLDLSAFIRRDSQTRSRAQWIETRYRWDSVEVALQWQLYSGGPTSLYGSVPQARRVDLLLRYFL
jgi:hypothetical protein